MKYQEEVVVVQQKIIAGDIYSMWLKTENIAREAVCGQFVSVYCKDGSRILPRPISICEINKEEGLLRLVYRIAGKGTKEFSGYVEGDTLKITGPLGNGFTLFPEKKAMLMAGGIGIPPMVETAKSLKKAGCKDIKIVVGYRDSENFLKSELEQYGKVYIATDDGSVGTKGNVIDAVTEQKLDTDVIYACGPTPMLRAVKALAEKNSIEAYVSMEEKMACGIGACLACVCNSVEVDEHSHVHNKRVCKDGPVFNVKEVEL